MNTREETQQGSSSAVTTTSTTNVTLGITTTSTSTPTETKTPTYYFNFVYEEQQNKPSSTERPQVKSELKLPNAYQTTTNAKNPSHEKDRKALSLRIISLLVNAQANFDSVKIKRFITKSSNLGLGSIIIGLYEAQLLSYSFLSALILGKNEVAKEREIIAWWNSQKNRIASKYASDYQPPKAKTKPMLLGLLKDFLLQAEYEKKLVTDFEGAITQYARKKFYTYKFGNSFCYSVNPDDSSMGIRFNEDGQPLKDEFGTPLTDQSGDFRYSIVSVDEDGVIKSEEEVKRGTKDATPMADKNGKALSLKYAEIIKNQKPKTSNQSSAQAINSLLHFINTASAEDICNYISTPSFTQKLLEAKGVSLFWEESLHTICRKFVEQYQAFTQKFSNKNLLSVLMDEDVYQTLSDKDLEKLLYSYPAKLVADVILNLYQQNFKGDEFNSLKLQGILEDDPNVLEMLNKKKCSLKTSLLLPVDSRLPGKNPLQEEQLTKMQLFQYDDTTITALEQYVRDSFKSIIINSNFSSSSSSSSTPKDPKVPYYFYLIPTNAYMLLDPKGKINVNYFRFLKFKADITSLLEDRNMSQFGKPVIFFGIINFEGTHYIPYFIQKTKLGGIRVITVDSSPAVYAEDKQDKYHVDAKTETQKKLKEIFEYIFPGSQHDDPQVTQMLRERDCGPNSMQTLWDVLASTLTDAPLLVDFDQDSHLKLDSDRLTINAKPQGVHPYSQSYVYSAELERKTNANREKWQNILMGIHEIVHLCRPDWFQDYPVQMTDEYESLVENYSYTAQVESQTLNDQRYVNVSAIQAILLSEEKFKGLLEDLTNHYKTTLQLGDLNPIASLLLSKLSPAQLDEYTATHDKDILVLLEDVAVCMLRDVIPEALLNTFNQILTTLPNSSDLKADKVASRFLETHAAVFNKLTAYEQAALKNTLIRRSSQPIKEKLILIHTEICEDLFKRNIYAYLTKLPVEPGEVLPPTGMSDRLYVAVHGLEGEQNSIFIDQANKYPPDLIREAITFLKINHPEKLKTICTEVVKNSSMEILEATKDYALNQLGFFSKPFAELLNYVGKDNAFLYPEPKTFLPSKSDGKILSVKDIESVLGLWVIQSINYVIFGELRVILQDKISEKVARFQKKARIYDRYFKMSIEELFNQLDGDKLKYGIELDFDVKKPTQHLAIETAKSKDSQKTTSSALPLFERLLNNRKQSDSTPIPIKVENQETGITGEEYEDPRIHRFIETKLVADLVYLIKMILNTRFSELSVYLLQPAENFSYGKMKNPLNLDVANLVEQIINSADMDSFSKQATETFKVVFASNDSPCYRSFYDFFHSRVLRIVENNHAISVFVSHIQELQSTLRKFSSYYEFLSNKLQPAIEKVDAFILSLDSLSLIGELSLPERELSDLQRSIVSDLISIWTLSYVKGDIRPGSFTCIIRLIACSLLGLETPRVLTSNTAFELDSQLFAKAQDKTQVVFKNPSLVQMQVLTKPPVTYNKPITRQLLLKILSYWYSNFTIVDKLSFAWSDTPLIIQRMVKIVNEGKTLQEPLTNEEVTVLLSTLHPLSVDEQIFLAKDITSKVIAAIMITKDFDGELSTSKLTFGIISSLLSGQDVAEELKKSKEKRVLSYEEYEQMVSERYDDKLTEILVHKTQNTSNSSSTTVIEEEVDMNAIINEILEKYTVKGLQLKEKESISFAQLSAMALELYREHNKELTRQDNVAIAAEEKKRGKPLEQEQISAIKKPRKQLEAFKNDLKQKYTILTVPGLEESENVNVNILPPSLLQRRGISSLGFFNTDLDRLILCLKARHEGSDDHLDEWDLKRFKFHLESRWNKLSLEKKTRGDLALHYQVSKPDARDSQYIVIAGLLVQYYKMKGINFCKYELLMPGYFLASKDLKTTKPPQDIINQVAQISTNVVYDTAMAEKEDLNIEMTIDDIPLSELVVLPTGYAISVEWVIMKYAKNRELLNPYTKNVLSSDELNWILQHPSGYKLFESVATNCLPRITPIAIDLLEEYVNATVLEKGYIGLYSTSETEASNTALKRLSKAIETNLTPGDQEAFWAEKIQSNGRTIREQIEMGTRECITTGGTYLAEVVIAYKQGDSILKGFIKARVNFVAKRNFKTDEDVLLHFSDEEKQILDYYKKDSMRTDVSKRL